MKPIHIVLFMTRGISIANWDNAGILKREMALYEKFMEQGHTVSIISHGGIEDLKYEKAFLRLKVLCNTHNLPSRLYNLLVPVLHRKTLRNATILKTNQSRGLTEAARCSRLFNKPLIARCGFMWSFTEKENGDMHAFRKAFSEEQTGFKHARACIVTTDVMRKYMLKEHGIDHDKINVLPNYVVKNFYDVTPTAPKPHVIRAVGRLASEKNLFNLIEACAELDAKLEIIGQGPLHEKLQQYAQEVGTDLDLPGAVAHHDLPSILASSTTFVQVSLYEGHPKTIIEAMACGLPVIGTDVTGIRDVIDHEKTGLLCEITPSSIREAIKRMLASPELRTTMGQAAKLWAEQYALDTIASKELAIYETISQQSKG